MSAYHFTPVYGNGWEAVLSIIERLWAVLKKTVSPLMEMASKQFSSFMELLVQLCLTLCATVSYGLWKWLASSSPIYGTACATVSYALCNSVLRLMEMAGKQSSPFMEMVSKQSSPFMELRSQLEIELADLEEIEVELSPAEAKLCSGRHAF